jgi:cytochrome c-type biogenesis protein
MHRYITVAAIAAFVFIAVFAYTGCGKKEDPSTKYNSNKDKQQTTQQQNTQQQNTQQTSGGTAHYVKSMGTPGGKGEMVDYSWSEGGKEMKLSDHKGKVILVNFWATWCPPCRKELPDLSRISTELKDKNFVMIGVSVDDNKEVLDKFLQTNKLPYTMVFEPTSELVNKYMESAGQNQNVVPQTYIIDKNGKIVEAILGSRSKEDFLKLINKYL